MSAPASNAEREEMCLEACKVIMLDVAPKALDDDFTSFAITAPAEELASIRRLATNLRQAAQDSKGKMNEKGQAAAESLKKAPSKVSGSGPSVIGTLLNKAVDGAGLAIGGAASLAGAGAGKALTMLADNIENQLANLDAKFTEAGKEFLVAKKEHIKQAYTDSIPGCSFPRAQYLMRGGATDAVCQAFHTECLEQLSSKLQHQAQDITKSKGLIKTWDAIVQLVNDANKQLGQFEWAAKFKQEPIKLDINKYIAEQTCMQLLPAMSRHEAALRKMPNQFLVKVCLKKQITSSEARILKRASPS